VTGGTRRQGGSKRSAEETEGRGYESIKSLPPNHQCLPPHPRHLNIPARNMKSPCGKTYLQASTIPSHTQTTKPILKPPMLSKTPTLLNKRPCPWFWNSGAAGDFSGLQGCGNAKPWFRTLKALGARRHVRLSEGRNQNRVIPQLALLCRQTDPRRLSRNGKTGGGITDSNRCRLSSRYTSKNI